MTTSRVAALYIGALLGPSVLIVPWEGAFGWDRSTVSAAAAVGILLYGLMGPFAAALMNRFGVRRVIVCAVVLISGGLLSSLMMKQVWQLVLLWGVVVGVGTGLTAMVLAATVVANESIQAVETHIRVRRGAVS